MLLKDCYAGSAQDIYQVVFWFGQHRTSNRRELTAKGADDTTPDETKINQSQGRPGRIIIV